MRGSKWIINQRGYANVVEITKDGHAAQGGEGEIKNTELPAPYRSSSPTLATAAQDPTLNCGESAVKGQEIHTNTPFVAWLSEANGSELGTALEGQSLVYGLVYAIHPSDEAALDGYEGVPWAYTKEIHSIEFWSSSKEMPSADSQDSRRSQTVQALVYVDRKRVKPAMPKAEYVERMRRGANEAKKWGIPVQWLKQVIGGFVNLRDEDLEER